MDIRVQLLSFFVSFLFGIFYFINSFVILYYLRKFNRYIGVFISSLYGVFMAFLYIYFMYKINYADIHLYFILFLFLGFLIGKLIVNALKNYIFM